MDDRWLEQHVVGISVSDAEDLLGHGLGRDHLRELLIRVARPLLRVGADLAYGGNFKPDEETGRQSFTRDLIDLIGDEQREGDGGTEVLRGILYNHSPWPHYLDITQEDEADYIVVCRFVRITQERAGLAPADVVHDEADTTPERIAFNRAVVLTAMRRYMIEGIEIEQPGHDPDDIPPVDARIIVGGKTSGFTGVLPGLYEEALFCREKNLPLYILGGFGGAGARLAGFLSGQLDRAEARLTLTSLREAAPQLETLERGFDTFVLPAGAHKPAQALNKLVSRLKTLKGQLERQNGLSRTENARLFITTDTAEAATLVERGLRAWIDLKRRQAEEQAHPESPSD